VRRAAGAFSVCIGSLRLAGLIWQSFFWKKLDPRVKPWVKPAGDGEWSEFNLIGIRSNRRQGWQVAILFLTTLVLDARLGVLSIEGSV
jgi:hypothetical protein